MSAMPVTSPRIEPEVILPPASAINDASEPRQQPAGERSGLHFDVFTRAGSST